MFCALCACLCSIAPFTTQLTSITLSGDMSPAFDFDWDLLFTAPSHTLTHFSTNTELDDTLLGILLDSAPALKCVSVDMISLDEDTHMNRTWAVETVCVESEEDGLECVRYLPKRADGGSVTVKGPCWQPEIHVTGVEVGYRLTQSAYTHHRVRVTSYVCTSTVCTSYGVSASSSPHLSMYCACNCPVRGCEKKPQTTVGAWCIQAV